jgi:catechol 2,3-dioxygenase-like lactoylglutathione lyase family enzyme
MIKYAGINHLAMVTKDMDKTVRFWRDLLGMRLVAGLGKPGYRHYFFEISETDLIAFFEWPGADPVEEKDHGYPVKGPFIFDHVSFGVEKQEYLWELKDLLEAAGHWVSEAIDHGFIHSIYAFDPNGIPIEFSWRVEGVDIRKKPCMVDSAPSPVTLEGPRPSPGKWPAVRDATPSDDRRVYPGQGADLVSREKKNWYSVE